MAGTSLYELTADFAALRDAVEWTDPETGEVLEGDALAPLLEALKGDIAQKAGGVLCVAAEFRHRAAGFKAEEERLAKRRKVLENAEKRMKAYVAESMESLGLKKLEAATFKVTLCAGKDSVVMEDPEKVPEDFKKWEWAPDIAGAKEMLKTTGCLPAGFAAIGGKSYVRIA